MTHRRPVLAAAGAALALATALSCGDVPTLEQGVAFISGVVSPSMAVAVGDTLRDSLGRVSPLRVYAFGRANEHDTLPGIPVTYLVTSLDTGVKIDDATGILRITNDSVRAVRIVGQVIGALQTPEFTLQVVPQPDTLQPRLVNDSIRGNASLAAIVSDPLEVTVSGTRKGARVGVPYILVRYQIDSVKGIPAGAAPPDSAFALVDEGRRFNLRSPRVALDTTDGSGMASRRVRVSTDAFDTVYVSVRAQNLKGVPLTGSPASFVLVRGY